MNFEILNGSIYGTLDSNDIMLRILLAILCGGVIGLERSIKHMTAGFRTHILVCMGAAIAMMTNIYIYNATGGVGDIARLGAQVINGIGFLGAGAIILTSRNKIRGLTTAAGLWTCACLGLAIGAGVYSIVVVSTVSILVIFTLLPGLEKLLTKHSKYFELHMEFLDRKNMTEFVTHIRSLGLKVTSVEYNAAYSNSGISVYSITILMPRKLKKRHEAYVEDFKKLDYINYIELVG